MNHKLLKSLLLQGIHNPSLLKSRIFIRIGSLLIVLGLITSQVGLNFFHSHRSTATEKHHVASIKIEDTTTPCSVCALGVLPMLIVQSSTILSVTPFSTDFILRTAANVLVHAPSAAFGRAPPVR